MNRKRVFQVNTELYKVTGIQRVILDIHEALKDDFNIRIVGNIPYDKVNVNLDISEKDYIRLRNPFVFRNSVVIIHERRLLPFMWLLTHIPGMNVKCVYVHHNELYGNKKLSLFPRNIVAISDAGIRNLTEYFRVDRKAITKIYNCVRETNSAVPCNKRYNPEDIKILYPARINDVKQQIEIVNHLKGKLDSRVKILFAGTGPLLDKLKDVCKGSNQFIVLGFRDDIPDLMKKSDFIMLFSTQEGLPISLIEGIQAGLPAICNNVGGNTEIISDEQNGIIVNSWNDLLSTLNSLPLKSEAEIKKMRNCSREKYLEEFTFDNFQKKYLNLIKNIYDNA